MIWLSWRQARASLVTAAAAVCAVVAVVLVTGPRLADLARRSSSVYDALTGTDRTLFYAGIALVALTPGMVGAFWGAPLIARELEAGTHRLAWTQSVTRSRWLTGKMVVITAAAAAAVAAVSLSVTWWSAPLDGATSATHGALPSRLTPISFAMRGVAPVGYVVLAVVLGLAVGAVLRRTLPAMALTLALYLIVQIVVPVWVRPHLIPPVTATLSFSQATLDGISLDPQGTLSITLHTANRDDWVLSNDTIDARGAITTLPAWFSSCAGTGPDQPAAQTPSQAPGVTESQGLGGSTAQARAASPGTCLTRLSDAGYRQRLVYQPASRFWPLQWAETALYLAVSALLLAGTFWWTRHRIS